VNLEIIYLEIDCQNPSSYSPVIAEGHIGEIEMLTKVKIKDIKANPFQARRGYDPEGIKALSDEIRTVGLWPGALRGRRRDGNVELCFGHRRWEAVKRLGWDTVEVDIVDLADDEMATQSLIENLQREGLNDLDKAEGIAALVKQLQRSKGFDNARAVKEVSSKLGLTPAWTEQIMALTGFEEPAKEAIRQGRIKGRTALEAYRIGGAKMVVTAAEKSLPVHTLTKIGTKLAQIKDKDVKERIKREVIEGRLTGPDEVERKARVMAAHRQKDVPPDLNEVVLKWALIIEDWTEQLDAVLPYREYLDNAPKIAERFRTAIRGFIERLEKFL
jgi:ParB family chromosome partitioning protein